MPQATPQPASQTGHNPPPAVPTGQIPIQPNIQGQAPSTPGPVFPMHLVNIRPRRLWLRHRLIELSNLVSNVG